MEHTGHLTGHDAAPLHVALKHSAAETAEGDVFQLLQRGSTLFQGEVFPCHFVFQHPHRPADGAARDSGVAVLGLQKGLLVIFMDGALPACQQAGAHLNTAGPQSEGRGRLPSIGNAAGGIADGRQAAAAFALGACGIQVGTCLLASRECPIHENYKQALLKAKDSDTTVTGRSIGGPVRVLKNKMAREYLALEKRGATLEELEHVTLGGLRRAVFEGDMERGSVMAGQVAGMLHEIKPLRQIFEELYTGSQAVLKATEAAWR